MSRAKFISVILIGLSLTSCSSLKCPEGATVISTDSLFFGSATPAGTVTEEQWSDFIDRVVTPSFPDGFTVVTSRGQWKRNDGSIVREPGHLLFIVHPPDASADKKVIGIIQHYKTKFNQESVMRITGQGCVSF